MIALISPSARAALVLGAVLAVGACARSDREAAADTAAIAAARTDTATIGGAVTGANWTDAQIISMLRAANTGEIAAGELAQRQATGAQVKAFARRLVTDHTALLKNVDDLAAKQNVQQTPPPDSSLIKDSNDALEDLQKKDRGADWDEDFLEAQIDIHQKTLDMLDRAGNAAQAPELRQAIQQGRPTIQAHLDEARRLKDTRTS